MTCGPHHASRMPHHVKRRTARSDPGDESPRKRRWTSQRSPPAAANMVAQMSRPEVSITASSKSTIDFRNLLKRRGRRPARRYSTSPSRSSGQQDRAAFRAAVGAGCDHRHVRSAPKSPDPIQTHSIGIFQMSITACPVRRPGRTPTNCSAGRRRPSRAEQNFYHSASPQEPRCSSAEVNRHPAVPNSTPTGMPPAKHHHHQRRRPPLPVRSHEPPNESIRLSGYPFDPLLNFLTVGFLAPVFRDALDLRSSNKQAAPLRIAFPVRRFSSTGFYQVHSPGDRPPASGSTLRQAVPCPQHVGLSGDVDFVCGELFSHRVSVEAMIEVAMSLAIPYILIGIAWSFVHADDVQRIETQLQTACREYRFGRVRYHDRVVARPASRAGCCDKTETMSPSSARLWLHGPSHAPRALDPARS